MKLSATSFLYRRLPETFYVPVEPTPWKNIKPLVVNARLAETLCIESSWLRSKQGLAVLAGHAALDGHKPIAMAYSGHQFGHWSSLLGDGRARLVGDVVCLDRQSYELHLKGAGRTPYSRGGDGKATLGSAIREYVVSEGMAALGVPTTRSLAVLSTGDMIQRQGFEPGAILCRTALSHIRVGTFQYAASLRSEDSLRALADFAIDRLFAQAPPSGPDRYGHLLQEVAKRQGNLVAMWMGFGFIHGVMNTDNMTISGETIDYGPCAFMDEFHPAKVFSSIDRQGRYAWNRQPDIAHWNLARLGEALMPLLGESEESQKTVIETTLDVFIQAFQHSFHTIMAKKFGLDPHAEGATEFIGISLQAMTEGRVDFTVFFRALTLLAMGGGEEGVLNQFNNKSVGEAWLEQWKSISRFAKKPRKDREDRLSAMQKANPIIVPRNHQIELAIAEANHGQYARFYSLVAAVSSPFADRCDFHEFEEAPEPHEIVHQTFCGT